MVALGGDGRAVDAPEDVAFDAQAVVTRGNPLAQGAVDDAAVVLFALRAVDVMDEKVRNHDARERARVVRDNIDPAPRLVAWAVVGQLQAAHLDLPGVVENQRVLERSGRLDARARAFAIRAKHHRPARPALGGDPELSRPDAACLEKHPVPRLEGGGIGFCERAPCGRRGEPVAGVVAGKGVEVLKQHFHVNRFSINRVGRPAACASWD